MPTAIADDRRLTRWVVAGSVVIVLVAIVIAVAVSYRGSDDAPSTETVALTSSARHQFTELDQLVAASDLIVVGRVVADEKGRVFGAKDGGTSAAIRSHVLTLEIDEVLRGASGSPTTTSGARPVVLIEEEHSLTDGTPVSVDGMRRSRVGDRGVWFLVASGDPEFPGYSVVNSQGRYLYVNGGLRGGDRSDRLVRSIEALESGLLETTLRN